MEVYINFYKCHFFFGDDNEFGSVFTNDDAPDTDTVSEQKTLESEEDSNAEDDSDDDDSDDDDDEWEDETSETLMGRREHCHA